MKKIIVISAILIFCFGCATMEVSYDFDHEVNFSAIKTYDWLPVPEKAKGDELLMKHIRSATNNELQAKGLKMSSENPDILIAIHGGKEKRVDFQEWGYAYDKHDYDHWGPGYPWGYYRQPAGRDYTEYRRGIDTYEYEIGTLMLDFVDAKKKELIWRGTARAVIDPGKSADQVNEAVKKILEPFPPVGKK